MVRLKYQHLVNHLSIRAKMMIRTKHLLSIGRSHLQSTCKIRNQLLLNSDKRGQKSVILGKVFSDSCSPIGR